MIYINSIEKKRMEIKQLSIETAPKEILLLRDGLEMYASAFAEAKPQEEPDLAVVRMSLVSHNFNTLYLASDATFSGFYLQALGSLRNVYENWLAFCYLEKYPDDKHFWLDADPNKRPPKAETMRNKIDHPSKESKAAIGDLYSTLCRFTHTDPLVSMQHFREVGGNPAVFVGLEFNMSYLHSCVYGISPWIGEMLVVLSDWIPHESKWHSLHKELSDRIYQYIDWYNELDWSTMVGP